MEQRNEERIARKAILEESKHRKELELIVSHQLIKISDFNFA